MPKCPIYDDSSACDQNPDCLFLRDGGCAVILGMTTSLENKKKLASISSQLRNIEMRLSTLK